MEIIEGSNEIVPADAGRARVQRRGDDLTCNAGEVPGVGPGQHAVARAPSWRTGTSSCRRRARRRPGARRPRHPAVGGQQERPRPRLGRLEKLGFAEYFVLPHDRLGPEVASRCARSRSGSTSRTAPSRSSTTSRPNAPRSPIILPAVRCYPAEQLTRTARAARVHPGDGHRGLPAAQADVPGGLPPGRRASRVHADRTRTSCARSTWR